MHAMADPSFFSYRCQKCGLPMRPQTTADLCTDVLFAKGSTLDLVRHNSKKMLADAVNKQRDKAKEALRDRKAEKKRREAKEYVQKVEMERERRRRADNKAWQALVQKSHGFRK